MWIVIEVDRSDSFVACPTMHCWPIGSRRPSATGTCPSKLRDWNVPTAHYTISWLLTQIDTEIVEISTCCIHMRRSDTWLRYTCDCVAHVLRAEEDTLLRILILTFNLVHRGICVGVWDIEICLFADQSVCYSFNAWGIRTVRHEFWSLRALGHPLVFFLFLALCIVVRYVQFFFIFDYCGSIRVNFWQEIASNDLLSRFIEWSSLSWPPVTH